MQDDPIVEEMRKNGQAFTASHNHDLTAIFNALKEKERQLGSRVTQREPFICTPEELLGENRGN